jgi:DNA-binding MarR family transcriptional regulator
VERTEADEALLAVARLVMDASVRAADDLDGLSPVQLRALTVLWQQPGANLAQLAEQMGVTVSTTSRLVDRLSSGAWVSRRPAEHNGREISLTLTDAGIAVLRRYDDGRLRRLHECLDRLPPDSRETVLRNLAEVATVSGTNAPATASRPSVRAGRAGIRS